MYLNEWLLKAACIVQNFSWFMFIASLFINRNTNEQVSFQVADALNQPFPDGQFDLVWSMESGEHMPDKEKVHYI